MILKDGNGNMRTLESNKDIEDGLTLFQGQNYVEILLEGAKEKGCHGRGKGHHGHHKMRSHSKGKEGKMTRQERRCMVLSKVYNGQPQ